MQIGKEKPMDEVTTDQHAEVIKKMFEVSRPDGDYCPMALLGTEDAAVVVGLANGDFDAQIDVLLVLVKEHPTQSVVYSADIWASRLPKGMPSQEWYRPSEAPDRTEALLVVNAKHASLELRMFPYHLEDERVVWDDLGDGPAHVEARRWDEVQAALV